MKPFKKYWWTPILIGILLLPALIAIAIDWVGHKLQEFVHPMFVLWDRLRDPEDPGPPPVLKPRSTDDAIAWLQVPFPEPGECGCHTCCWEKHGRSPSWMALCSVCGNKRCPKATDHKLACTHSNEPEQPGSVYGVTFPEFRALRKHKELDLFKPPGA